MTNGYQRPFFIGISVILALITVIWGMTLSSQSRADAVIESRVDENSTDIGQLQKQFSDMNALLQRIDQRTLDIDGRLKTYFAKSPYVTTQ